MSVRVQNEDFDLAKEVANVSRHNHDIGAVASFVGLVRDSNDGVTVREMSLEHYPGMTEAMLEKIEAEARRRWKLLDVVILHRVGRLVPGDRIVLVVVSSAHRGDAFSACEFLVDYLKTKAPFWKKEETPDGSRWVEARTSDDAAAQRWCR